MIRTNTTFTLLQAIAAVVSLATILWFVGVPSFRFAEAANVTSFSNTLSTSEPATDANHTISFVTPSAFGAGEIITITFPAEFSNIGNLEAGDIDLNVNGVEESLVDSVAAGADWGVTASGQTIDIESGTDTIGANATVTIRIGTNASSGGAGVNQIENPGTPGPYRIDLTFGNDDSGSTEVAIVPVVTVSATVETIFNFTVSGVDANLDVNGDTTTSTSSPTTVPFGILEADTPVTAAQDLQVYTNAANGFVVTVTTNQQLLSATGADIDGFVDGTYITTPIEWTSPTPVLGQENTYGHWGITTNDASVTPGLTDIFDVNGSG
ncbi:MAG TPA: hypothetical protein PKD95_03760, partial [Candidatus Paceibacterota bacterium]|nr:hypothetical protein [Candidatus Paceibacterota bacterium]